MARKFKFKPFEVPLDPPTDEEKVQGLMGYGYPETKARAIVSAGKWEETVERDHYALVEDPYGYMKEKVERSYAYVTTNNELEGEDPAYLPDPDPGEDYSRTPEFYEKGKDYSKS